MNNRQRSFQTERLIKEADRVIDTILDIIEGQQPPDDSHLVAMYYIQVCQFTARFNERAFDAMHKYLVEKSKE